MKNTLIKIIALVLVITTLTCVLASCGGLSGKYSGEIDLFFAKYKVTYNFSGSNVSVTHTTSNFITGSDTVVIDGKYEITESDNGKEITFTFEKEDDVVKSATYSFVEGENYIEINGVKYTKVD